MQDTRELIEVCFSPRQFELYQKHFDICVVIDVLRATSAICSGIENGINQIIPVATVEEAREMKEKGYITAAERNGGIVDGFDFGNSPYSFMNAELKGKDVVLSTTNGTNAIHTARGMETVVIGALSNLESLSQWLILQGKPTLLLCSGWKDKFNLEDTICAGAILDKLIASGQFKSEEDSSIAAKFIYFSAKENIFSFLKASSHRRRLRKLNLNEDVKYCLTPNTVTAIPILKDGALINLKKENVSM